MKGMFLEILGMSIMAGYVALIVMVIRLPLKKLPKIYSYALWAVVLFRLLCPFSIESAFSFIPALPDDVSWSAFTGQPSPGNIDTQENAALDMASLSSGGLEDQAASENMSAKRTWFTMAVYVWLAGIVLLLFHAMYGYMKLKRRLQTATWVRDNIYETDRIITPFVLGFIRPKIYIPLGIEDKDYILKHEQTHIRRYDYLIKPVAYLALCLHWFNPFIWLGYFLMCKDMEMSCDESVLKKSSRDIRRDYSGSLLALSVRQSGLLSPSAFGDGNAKIRIKNVLTYRKPEIWLSIATAIAILGVMLGCVLSPLKTDLIQSKLAIYAVHSNPEDSTAEEPLQEASSAGSPTDVSSAGSPTDASAPGSPTDAFAPNFPTDISVLKSLTADPGETRKGILSNNSRTISFSTLEATIAAMDLQLANNPEVVAVAQIIISGVAHDVPAEGLMLASAQRGGITITPDGIFYYIAPVCDHSGTDTVSDSFQYRTVDAGGRLNDPVTVTINITDTVPIAVDDNYALSQVHVALRFQANVMDNDIKSADWISRIHPGSVQNILWQIRPADGSAEITVPEGSYNPGGQATSVTAKGGRVWIDRDGNFAYEQPPRFEGYDSFQYRLNDGDGSPSNWATVT
ncbi:MAG: Ig-like domain-containing protein, partial [Peptococcaceae bacterium]|nr:Ig-like domain-containing protein [Peptococcaceae bacterium]